MSFSFIVRTNRGVRNLTINAEDRTHARKKGVRLLFAAGFIVKEMRDM